MSSRASRPAINRGDTSMLSFSDWIDAIRYRWKMVAAIAALFAVLGCVYIAVAPRTYRATSSLLLDIEGPDPTKDSSAEEKKVEASEVIATQVDLIKSPNVADLAAATSGIAKDPAMIAKWRKETDEEQPYRLWVRNRLEKSLTVIPGDESHILQIEAVAKSPEAAARIANGYAKASVASQHKLRTDAAKDYAAWLTQRLAGAKNEVVTTQEALSSFARSKGITNDGDVSSEGTQMAQVATQLAAAESAAAAARQNSFETAQGRGDSERSSGVQALRTQLAQADSRYANLSAQFGPDYPDVKRAKAEAETLQEQLNATMVTTTAAFGESRRAEAAAQRAAANASESRLRSLTAQQRARVQALGTNLAQYQRLKNEFIGAQRDYNELSQKLGAMKLQSTLPRTEVQVLNLAATPLEPDWPKPGLILLLAGLIGMILGSLAAIILEALNPRVRNWSAVERLLGARVIGSVALPSLLRGGIPRLSGPACG
ncbi:MAG: hypothetical protein ABW128_04470 [Rhizorhabdus sp.]